MQIARFAIFALILLTIVGPTVFRSARSRLRRKSLKNAAWFASEGFVTLPCRERGVSAPEELSGRSDCGPPRAIFGRTRQKPLPQFEKCGLIAFLKAFGVKTAWGQDDELEAVVAAVVFETDMNSDPPSTRIP
jgi:hypothetical protein